MLAFAGQTGRRMGELSSPTRKSASMNSIALSGGAPALATRLNWLVGKDSPVTGFKVNGPDSLAVIVRDQYSPKDSADLADLADIASSAMRQSLDGVNLVVRSEDGHVGEPQGNSGDELSTFIHALPGVNDYGYYAYDVNGDGYTADNENAHRVEAATNDYAAKLKHFLPETITEAVDQGPVVVDVTP